MRKLLWLLLAALPVYAQDVQRSEWDLYRGTSIIRRDVGTEADCIALAAELEPGRYGCRTITSVIVPEPEPEPPTEPEPEFDDDVTLSWVAPTENTDGTPLTDLAGFNVYWSGETSGDAHVDGTSYLLEGLAPGTWTFSVTAMNSAGAESDPATITYTIAEPVEPSEGGPMALVQELGSVNWAHSITNVVAGNALILVASGQSGATPVGGASSNVDGAFTEVYSIANHGAGNEDFFWVGILANATAGSHAISFTGTDLTARNSGLFEVSTLSGLLTDSNQAVNTSTQNWTTGDVTVAGEAFLAFIASRDGSGTITLGGAFTGVTPIVTGSRSVGAGVVVPSGGTYNGNHSINVARSGGAIIVAFAAAGGGGGDEFQAAWARGSNVVIQ